MSESNTEIELQTGQLLQESSLENDAPDPIIYGPRYTPNANPLGNLPLYTGIGVFVLIAVCVVAAIGETKKDEKDRDGWFKALVNYSIEKQEREGRAPADNEYGPFSRK